MAQDTGSKDIANATRNLISSVEKLYSQSKRVETSISTLNGSVGKMSKGSGDSATVNVLNKMLRELSGIGNKMLGVQTAIKFQQKNTSLLQSIAQTNSAQVAAIQQGNKKDNASSFNKLAQKLDSIQRNTSGKGDPRTTSLLSQILNTLRRQKPATIERQVAQPKQIEKPKVLTGQQYKDEDTERKQGTKTGDVGIGPLLALLGGISGPYVKKWYEELMDAINNIFNMEIIQGFKKILGTLKEWFKKWAKPLIDFADNLLNDTIKKTKDIGKYLSEKFDSWGKIFSEFADNASKKIGEFGKKFSETIDGWSSKAVEIGKNISEKFSELGKSVRETASKYIDEAITKITDIGKVVGEKISSWGKSFSDFATKFSDDTLTTLKNAKEFWSEKFSSATKTIGEMGSSLVENISSVIKNAGEAFMSQLSRAGKVLGNIGSSIADSVSNLSNKISSGFASATKSITSSIGALYDKLKPTSTPETPPAPPGKQVAALLQPKPEAPAPVETPVKPTFMERVSSAVSSAGSKVAEIGKNVSNKGTEYLTKAEKFIEGSADDLGKVGKNVSNVIGKGVKALPFIGAGAAVYDYGSRRSEISEDTDKKMKELEQQFASKQISEKEYQEKMAKARERDDIKKGLLNTEVGGGIAAAAIGTAAVVGSGGTGAALITGAAAAATDYFARKGLKIEEVPPVSLDEMADVYEKLTPMEGAQFKVELAGASGVEYVGASNTSNAIKRMIVEQFKDKIAERERKEKEKEKVSPAQKSTAPGAGVPGLAGNPSVSSTSSSVGKTPPASTETPGKTTSVRKQKDEKKTINAAPEVMAQHEKQSKKVETISAETVVPKASVEQLPSQKRKQKPGWSTEGMTHISNPTENELLDRPSGTYIAGELFSPGKQLSPKQLIAVKTSISMGGSVDPEVMAQYKKQSVSVDSKPTQIVSASIPSSPVLPVKSDSAADVLKTNSNELEKSRESVEKKPAQNVVINAPQNNNVTNMGGGQNVGSMSPRINTGSTFDRYQDRATASSYYGY